MATNGPGGKETSTLVKSQVNPRGVAISNGGASKIIYGTKQGGNGRRAYAVTGVGRGTSSRPTTVSRASPWTQPPRPTGSESVPDFLCQRRPKRKASLSPGGRPRCSSASPPTSCSSNEVPEPINLILLFFAIDWLGKVSACDSKTVHDCCCDAVGGQDRFPFPSQLDRTPAEKSSRRRGREGGGRDGVPHSSGFAVQKLKIDRTSKQLYYLFRLIFRAAARADRALPAPAPPPLYRAAAGRQIAKQSRNSSAAFQAGHAHKE